MSVQNWRKFAKRNPMVYRLWAIWKAAAFDRKVRSEMAHYSRFAAENGVSYSEQNTRDQVRRRLETRGLWGRRREDLHIFAVVRVRSWEHHLLQAFQEFGTLTKCDWNTLGYDEYAKDWSTERRAEIGRLLLDKVREAHRGKPIDLAFFYVSNRVLERSIIEEISRLGIITVNLSLDDWHGFGGTRWNGTPDGLRPLVSSFDLNWTNTSATCVYYLGEGAIPLYLPEGANPSVHRQYSVTRDLEVAFVGQCYGYRPILIDRLRRRAIEVHTFGPGWASGLLPEEEMVRIYSRSRITLGFGGVMYSRKVMCLKGRDFEVPMSGGLYLTSYNPELEACFVPGKEILCYRNVEELIELIQWGLRHPGELEKIREAGWRRALRDHTWRNRVFKLLETVGLLEDSHTSLEGRR